MPPKAKEMEPEPSFPSEEFVGQILNCFSADFTRLDNVHLIDDFTVLTATGNLVLTIEIGTQKVGWIQGLDGGGIGALTVHPSKTCFAVAEKIGSQTTAAKSPNVYIYSFPDKNLLKTLKGGTEKYYTAASFNSNGDKLATVGGESDFMLTIWNWEQECVILRFKAWGSEVFRVTFNPFDDGFLTTSGNGHIKFWEMASTFTGLKLQGAIGKFGKVDIQDIVGYAELPDGKVLSGSQDGCLLMWEANLLKTEIKQLDGSSCHEGPVEVVHLLEENQGDEVLRVFLSAGNDGKMRYWLFSDVDMADTTVYDHCRVKCLKTVTVNDNCCIRSIARGTTNWIIQDAQGAYWKTPVLSVTEILREAAEGAEAEPADIPSSKILQLHSGAITCVEASPNDYVCATGGQDGTLRLWAFLNKKELYTESYSSGLTCLHWVPLKFDKSGSLLVVGFANGILRVVRRTQTAFELCCAWKPHTESIRAFAFNEDYTWVATVSSAGDIFFFRTPQLAAEWIPIGESPLPESSPGNSVHWEGDRVVVGQENGNVIAVQRPDPSSIDPNVTFVFSCTTEKLVFSQKPKPPERQQKVAELNEDDNEEEEEEEEEEIIDLHTHDDQGPVPVNAVVRLPEKLGNSLIIAMQRAEGSYMYSGVSWQETDTEMTSEEPILNIAHYNSVVKRVKLSPMGTFLLVGCEQGTVMLRDAIGNHGTPLKKAYHINLGHDGRQEVRQSGVCLPGTIQGLAMSYDESILLSVSEDGSFLSYSLTEIPGAASPPPFHDVDFSAWPKLSSEVADISDKQALSIQQTKEKEDRDRAFAAAELKKLTLREKVQKLQEEYQLIVHENMEAAPGKQINKDELELDPEITRLLHEENDRKINEVAAKWAFETAKSDLAKKKLEEMYVECLKVDRIILRAFSRHDKCVSSFRTPQLTDRQKEKIEDMVHNLILNENHRREVHQDINRQASTEGPGQAQAPSGSPELSAQNLPLQTSESGEVQPAESEALNGTKPATVSMSATQKSLEKTHVKSQLEKAEERKRQRQERKAVREQLLAERPDNNQEDPKDAQMILKAEQNMGDKKLKIDPNYVVKETERVTAERKERQLVLLEESINTLRLDFNERFLAMRNLKERLIGNINRDLKKIDDINKKLKLDEKVRYYSIEPEEIPDKIRQESPDRQKLAQFEKERLKARRKAEKEAKAKAGFGGDLAGGDDDEEESDAEPADETDKLAQARKASIRTHQRRESHSISAEMRINLELKTKLEKLPKSGLEQEEEAMWRHQLLFDKKKLQRKIEKTITTFDDIIDELRREKFKLEGDLKMADMKILLLYRELVLLKEFKKRDEILTKKLEEHRNEKLEVTRKTTECQDRLNEKKVEIKQLLDRERSNMDEMLQLLRDLSQPIRDHLMKIFRKKVKRKQPKEGEEESEESSDDDWMSDDEEENDNDEEDVCPEGCDEEVYQAVLELRAKRLEQEDVVNDFQKSMDQLKKENESLTKREKTSTQKLQQVEREIQSFQTEKQQKLNQLETSIVLKLSQVQALTEEDKLPFNQSNLVVFTNGGMRDLCDRIVQLQTDKKALNREHNEHKRQHSQLSKEKRATEAFVKEWEQKVYEVQLLKFGQRVDLESLEDVSVDRQTEELKEKLRQEEARWERAMRVQGQALKKMKELQQNVIARNSELLKELGELQQEQQFLEEQLNVSQTKILTRMTGGSRIATAADRSNLKDLVVMQQREIDALKSEIAMLRRKGGHVYTPVVSKVVASAEQPAAG
ncbi:hypothetical protein DIPPA_70151 [Diplonema papillatum]|nr:hypothetical protein DIPPA_70151 [Diplonema papillatum]